MKLYKYKALPDKNKEENDQIKYCKDILLNNRLFMAPRETLNDPFEGMAYPVHLGISGTGSYETLGLPHPIVEERMNQYKILSLSANPKSPIMWAHYANNYSGICFEFEFDLDLYNIQKVSYIKEQYDVIDNPTEKELNNAIEKSLLCKSRNWSYEEEYRIISRKDENYFYFDKIELSSVIVGNRSVKSIYVQELIALAEKQNIPVYYIFASTKDYELNIIKKSPEDIIIGEDVVNNIRCN